MRDNDRFEDMIRKDLDVRASEKTHDRMKDIVLNAHGPTKTTVSAVPQILTRRTLTENPVAKLAVAAAILIALGLGISVFINTGSHSGVVWAQVADRVDASAGFIYRTRTIQKQADLDQPIEWSTMTYDSPRYGKRTEGIEGSAIDSYLSYEEGTHVTLLHDMKRYTQRALPPRPDGTPTDMGASDIAKIMVRQFTSGPYKELGRRMIDGVETEGIETHESAGFRGNFEVDSSTSQLWVSIETGYPVLIEREASGNNGTLQIKTVMDQFRWDIEFGPDEFQTVIPPDYEPLETLPGGGLRGQGIDR